MEVPLNSSIAMMKIYERDAGKAVSVVILANDMRIHELIALLAGDRKYYYFDKLSS